MNARLVLVATLGVIAGVALAATSVGAHGGVARTGGSVFAGGGHGSSGHFSGRGHGVSGGFSGRGGVFRGPAFAPHHGPHAFFPRHHRFFHGAVPFVAVAPPVIYSTSPFFYDAPDYAAPDPGVVGYGPPDSYGPPSGSVSLSSPAPPPAPPLPRVVEFREGRYELRGDGVTTPYTWVWVPAPPTAPPPPVPAPPLSSPAPAPAAQTAPARRTYLYRWVDPDGVVNWTNDLETVPEKYRARVKRIPS